MVPLSGHAQPVHKAGFQAGICHGLGDSLAATMYHNGVQPHGFHHHNIAHERLHQIRIIHGRAAKLDEDGLVTVCLQIRQCLDEDISLVNFLVRGNNLANGNHGQM